MINVYLTDDHPSIIYGVKNMLQGRDDMQLTACFSSGAELKAGLKEGLPDVLLLDIHLPDITGNELTRMISKKYPQVAILAFTNMNTDFHIKDMMGHGCLGYLMKTADTDTLVEAIKAVYAGKEFFETPLKAEVKDDMMQTKKQLQVLPALTKRELEIVQHIVAGKTNQEIADTLFLSLRTIENHRYNLQTKLRVKSMAELIRVALQAGWV